MYTENQVEQKIKSILTKTNIIKASMAFVFMIIFTSSIYTVEEGHVGIVKRFSKAIEQVDPGIHLKVPFIDSIVEIEVRTRKNEEKMASSTHEQMPITAHVSVNWTVDKAAALDLYKRYGGLTQFESRILDPRFRSATKDALPHFEAEQLVQDRSAAIALIEENFKKEMADFPLTIDNVQIENIVLPAKYIQSINTKQTEKNLAAAEEHKLARQKLLAQQSVNTAIANRDAAKATADGAAYAVEVAATAEATAIKIKGLAEAEAITAKAKALKNNNLIIELTKAQQWNGSYLTTGLGNGATPLVMIGK